jgi:glycosyltransferase involved in cell wall biosynthesis
MNLVYVINSLGAGGAEHHLLNLARDMALRDYKVWVIVLERNIIGGANSLEQAFIETGVNVIYLHSYAMNDFGRWFSLIRLIDKLRPDIIHSHLPRSDFSVSIVKTMFPDIYWISTIHDTYTKDKYSGYWIFTFVKRNWQRADRLIAVSKHVQKWIIEELRVFQEKTRVIYHGVSLYDLPDSIEKNNGEPMRIGCLARFEKRKNIETLIRAMPEVIKIFPSVQLLLAGSDPTNYSYTIKILIKKLRLEANVKIIGFSVTPLKFLHDLDVFAFSSLSEGFGIVLIEAMSVRRPIVASDIYPINHIVKHETTGLLVEPGNHHAFAQRLVELLGDGEKRRRMGDAGYQRCINEFSLEKSLNRVHDLYVELISEAPSH